MNAENAETIREAVNDTGFLPEFDADDTVWTVEIAALAYASLLDGSDPERILIRRDAASIKVVDTRDMHVGLGEGDAEDGDKPVGRYYLGGGT